MAQENVSLIKTIANKLRDGKLENISSVEKEIAVLGGYLGTNQMQTIIFVAIFDRTSSGSNSDIDDISRYFECSTLDIVEHKKDFDKLLSGGLIEKVRGRRECTNFTSANFRVPTVVFEAILCDEPLNNAKSVQSGPDYFDLVKEIGEWLENWDKDEMSTATFLAQTKEQEESFSSCDFVKQGLQHVQVLQKGRKPDMKKSEMNFAAIDFETANECRSSVCSVGVVIVRKGKIVDKFYSLINPEPGYYKWFCSQVHGLCEEDTCKAPVFSEVWKQIAPKIEGLPLVAHNACFDEGCLKAAFQVYQMDYPDYTFYDTLAASRAHFGHSLENHQLHTVAAACGYDLTQHHHALADAEACAAIAMKIL